MPSPTATTRSTSTLPGLEPGVVYHYGFEAAGEVSPTGRTWTLRPDADRLRFATCSCAKRNAGYFNAYGRIAERDDQM